MSQQIGNTRQWAKPHVVAVCGLLALCVGVLDLVTGMEASMAVIYLFPTAIGTWLVSRRAGGVLAVSCVLIWLVVERMQGIPYSHPLIQYWNAIALLVSFMSVVFLLSALKESREHLEHRVAERTAELASEIAVRKATEQNLAQTNLSLSRSREDLMRSLSDLQKSHSELVAAQLQLIQAAKMESIGRLAAGVAHEVKNPLTTILMGVDYLQQCCDPSKPAMATVLNDQRDAAQRAAAVINELLDFSVPGELRRQLQDVDSIIESALRLARHQLIKANIKVVKELEPGLPRLWLDRNKIEQVLLNVFINAAHAMPGGGTMTVRTHSLARAPTTGVAGLEAPPAAVDGAVAVVEVDDTGSGIPEQHLDKVFDPFFTTKAPGMGSGLGLSVVHQIIDMHGGTVDLSNHPEGGARFTIRFTQTPEDDHGYENSCHR